MQSIYLYFTMHTAADETRFILCCSSRGIAQGLNSLQSHSKGKSNNGLLNSLLAQFAMACSFEEEVSVP